MSSFTSNTLLIPKQNLLTAFKVYRFMLQCRNLYLVKCYDVIKRESYSCVTQSTVGKRAKRAPDITVETTKGYCHEFVTDYFSICELCQCEINFTCKKIIPKMIFKNYSLLTNNKTMIKCIYLFFTIQGSGFAAQTRREH